ncbi:MAG TPA: D-alanyl-D-alanine carboxypeptidase [Candidatus Kaiserbacteria bacterium]|nr:D-alanyl-D-alanine carboxypeptidase [Candidatus Kaiserbacteria bacterium]
MKLSTFNPFRNSALRVNTKKHEASVALLFSVFILGGLYLLPTTNASIVKIPTPTIHTTTPNAYKNLSIHAKAGIVYDLATHKTLFAKNADAQLPLASITKLLTTYTAVKELGLNTPITIKRSDIAVEGNSGFSPGEIFTVRSLARITLTGSVNDGAAALARASSIRVGSGIPRMLAGAAASLDLSQTYALDGSGLDTSDTVSGGYGSAHDVALLAGALLKEAPSIVEATTQISDTEYSESGTAHTKLNTNRHVTNTPRILLSKTGYTDLAGGNLVVVFDASINHPIAVVALGSTEKARFTDVDAMIAATIAHFSHIQRL